MSAGLGSVPAEQTYLDIGQGNRVFDSLYDPSDLPPGSDCRVSTFEAIKRRAESAPAEIVPHLLTDELFGPGGVVVFASGPSSCAFGIFRGPVGTGDNGSLVVLNGSLTRAAAQGKRSKLVIAIEKPPPAKDAQLAIGIAGPGFDGNLTSDSTRLDGYVLSTDLAPTILDFFGVPVPDEMSGQPIRSEGDVDPAAVESLGSRMAVISERRGPVIGLALLVWLLSLAAIVAVARAGSATRGAVRVVGLSVVYLPLVLLIGAAIEPSRAVETALTIVIAPLLAYLTVRLATGYRALAAASGLTVAACAIDVIAGSPLTALSLLGPDPGLGVRFYGIGNELESLLSVLVIGGTGAALAGYLPRLPRERAAAAFLLIGLVLAFVFAAGRFGADVGAAIVLPFGAAVAAAVIGARGIRSALLIVAAPVAAVGLLALIDLASGANSHLTRSVLDAGGLHQVGEVAQRRLELSAHSFARPVVYLFMPLVIAVAAAAYLGRDRIAAWLREVPAMRAGMIGALGAVLIGALANDSGALVIEIGAAYLTAFLGFAWAES
ncbi:MAG TPA: hypothetical protein VGF09_03095 [Solirubrobacterales bacterium]